MNNVMTLGEISMGCGLIEEGSHIAKIISIRLKRNIITNKGYNANRLVLTFQLEDGRVKTQGYIASYRRNSEFGKVLMSLNGQISPEFNLNELIGRVCEIEIAYNEDRSGRTWDNVVSVKPTDKEFQDVEESAYEELGYEPFGDGEAQGAEIW